MPRHGGIGPARGNGNSSKPAERPAAAHNFHEPRRILGRVYCIAFKHVALPTAAGILTLWGRSRSGRKSAGLFVELRRKPATIEDMLLAILGMRLLEVMFFVGLAGSTIVVLISFVEDAKELFGDE